MRKKPILLIFLLIALATLAWSRIGTDGPSKDKTAMKEMLGTFTDPAGTTGNYLNLELVPEKLDAADNGPLKARFGHGHIHELFGVKDAEISWGYSEYKPLRINVIAQNVTRELPASGQFVITATDHDHLNIQTGKEVTSPGKALLNIQAIALKRTKEPEFPSPNF